MLLDWHQFHASERKPAATVDARRRLRVCALGFVVLCGIVFGRVVLLATTQGETFRQEAAKPLERRQSLPGVRGRILAGNGAVLAHEKKALALAVQYRYLEDPPDARWLRWTARSRLPRAQRKDREQVAAEEARLEVERAELGRRLAGLCGLSPEEWKRRAKLIQTRVQKIADGVNRRQAENPPEDSPAPLESESFWARAKFAVREALRASMSESSPERITVAEELDYHLMAEDVPLAVVAEVEANPARYPGARVLSRTRRDYPFGPLACHLLGYLGANEEQQPLDADRYHAEDRVGRTGLEQQYERLLHGSRGTVVELTDHSGRVLSSRREREPGIGRDLVLTVDPRLQETAETLLESALRRRSPTSPHREPCGGAIVVMDVRNGAILAAASAPRFNAELFARGDNAQVAALLSDPGHPLFDRATRMAIAPGSVFKTVSAVALLQHAAVEPEEPFLCQGYLHEPDRLRCAIYRRHGIGHGQVTLADALTLSCNVYFFHHAGELGPDRLVDWAARFGFGQRTGVDLPNEAPGSLPSPDMIRKLEGRAWRTGDTQLLAIGQGALQATPLQVVRMMAAIANGGRLVTPHLVSSLGLPELAEGRSTAELPDDPIRIPASKPIADLRPATLAEIRKGLKRVVCDPRGTAHGSVWLDSIEVSGKTGTAETAVEGADHAWFAGYAPSEAPKLALVVALEYGGNADESAGPVAKRLVLRMQQLGLL